MTRVIDIEARAMERDTYRPMFRCNELDRRRDRKVVVRPNDGPGDIATRYELAQERKDALERRKHARAAGETYHEAQARVSAHNRRVILQALAQYGQMNLFELSDASGLDVGAVSLFTARMENEGFITREREGGFKTKPLIMNITEVGQQQLAANKDTPHGQ